MLTKEHANATNKLFKSVVCVAVSAVMCISFSLPTQAFAVTAAEKKAQADSALSTLMAMETKLNDAEANYSQALDEQYTAQTRMEEAQTKIDEASERISDLQDQLAVRARSMYRTGSSSFLDLILGSTSFHALTTNWDILNDLNQQDADLVSETKTLRAEVEDEKAVYEEQEKVAEAKAEEMDAIVEEMQTVYNEQQSVYNTLSAEAKQLYEQEKAAAETQRQQQASNGGGGKNNRPTYNEPAYVASSGNAIVDRARGWVNRASYVRGACEPGAFDCSGFVSYCVSGSYRRLGTSTSMYNNWARVSNPQPGDVCAKPGHVGIYIGGGRMIHAASPGQGVVEGPVQSGMIYVRY